MSNTTKLIIINVISLIGIVLLFPHTIYALESQQSNVSYILDFPTGKTYLDTAKWCSTNDKSWITSVKSCNNGGGVIADFDEKTSSWVLLKLNIADTVDGQGRTLKYNRYKLFTVPAPNKLTFYKNSTDGQYYLTATSTISYIEIRAEPNTDMDYRYNWTGTFAQNQFTTQGKGSYTPISTWKGYLIGPDVYSGQVSAINVNYSTSWDYAQLNNTVISGTDGIEGCAALDIGCWVTSITSGFSAGIKELFALFIDAVEYVFVPNSQAISAEFDLMLDNLNTNLGFLAYPLTFTVDMLQAFDSESSWCNATSCKKELGNVMGGTMSLDLGQFQKITPTIWEFVTIAARGLMVISIILMIRGKWYSVVTK